MLTFASEWNQFVAIQASKWLDMATNWTKFGQEALVLHYEDLKSQPEVEMTRVLRHLHLPLDEERLKCAIKHSDGNFRRNQSGQKGREEKTIAFSKVQSSR